MGNFALVVSVASGFVSVAGFIGIFVKLGRERGESDSERKEMRKDIDKNAKDIDALGMKVNQMQLENSKMITALSSDLGWIKASLSDIKQEISRKRGAENA